MLLSAQALYPICNVNDFSFATQVSWTQGDTVTLYIQLVDATRNVASQGYQPSGLRYMPVAGATLQVAIQNLDAGKVITRFANQPFAQDPSIWAVAILATDTLRGCPDIVLTLVEPVGSGPTTQTTTGRVQGMLTVASSATNAVPPAPPLSLS